MSDDPRPPLPSPCFEVGPVCGPFGVRPGRAATPRTGPRRRRAGDEPIIDAARLPLTDFRKGGAARPTPARYLWLRVLRPALTLAIWCCVIGYAWPYVQGAGSQPEVLQLLGLYARVIGAILLAMLLMAPWRRRLQRSEAAPNQEASSLFALAAHIQVPTARLSTWQRMRQLRVQHDGNGQLRAAADGACPRPRNEAQRGALAGPGAAALSGEAATIARTPANAPAPTRPEAQVAHSASSRSEIAHAAPASSPAQGKPAPRTWRIPAWEIGD